MPVSADVTEVTPEAVLLFEAPTPAFLCSLAANVYNIEFLAFGIRDIEAKTTLFEIRKDADITTAGAPPPSHQCGSDDELDHTEWSEGEAADATDSDGEEASRSIRYHFGPQFLRLRTVGTSLEFKVGDHAVKDFRMIERHYFKDRLMRSYDFSVPFCMPGSTNTMEAIYDLPQLDADDEAELVANPWETRSDSFYFVEGKLVMHNKAEYSYTPV